MKLTFYGAAKEVTGSQHMLQVNGKNVLLDCGMFQGHRKEAAQKNCELLYDPKEIDNMVLSHAHLDHCGRIPYITKNGFKGNIFCTFATRDLSQLMLADSAHIQEMDEEYFQKQQRRGKAHPIENCMLYNTDDAKDAMQYFMGLNYLRPFQVTPNIKATFYDAGHILGSALTLYELSEKNKHTRFLFTGDLGRKGLPILRDPDQIPEADYLMIESTYGNRKHDEIGNVQEQLIEVITRTVERKGKIIIPAFAMERTQELVYQLHRLVQNKSIPKLDIYVDSPLAGNVTEIFQMHPECYDQEIYDEFLKNRINPFGFGDLTYTRSTDESKALNDLNGPFIIISAAGMCEAGRIRHHLANNIEDPRNTILVVGFMAKHTLGRKIVELEPEVKIFDTMYKLRAEVVVLNAFSAHADKDELFNYVKNIKGLKKVFLVHGEEENSVPFAEKIQSELGIEVVIPGLGESAELE